MLTQDDHDIMRSRLTVQAQARYHKSDRIDAHKMTEAAHITAHTGKRAAALCIAAQSHVSIDVLTYRWDNTFRTDGTDTGVAMRATERGRDASLVAMVAGDRVDARALYVAERYKATRGGSIVMQVVQHDYVCGLIPEDEQAARLIRAANRRMRPHR